MAVKVIQLYDPIGEWDMSAQRFARHVQEAKGHDIELRICSPGGDAAHGFAIANMLLGHVGKKTAVVEGYCASAATLPAIYCDELHMHEMSMLMVHRSSAGVHGHAEDLQDVAQVLSSLDSLVAAAYKRKTGASDAQVAEWLSKDTWMTAQQAADAGFCQKVIAGPSRVSAQARARTTQFFCMAGRPPPALPTIPKSVPTSPGVKMKPTPVARGLLVALSGIAHYGALAAASEDPEERALGEQLAALDLSAHTAQLADITSPALADLLSVHAKAVELVGSEEGITGGLEAIARNAAAKGAQTVTTRSAQVEALIQPALTGKVRKLSPADAVRWRAAYTKDPAKPLADLQTFLRLAQPLMELNTEEDQGARASASDDDDSSGEIDPEFKRHALAGKVLS